MEAVIADLTPFAIGIIKRAQDWQRLSTEHTYHVPLSQFTRINHCEGIAWYFPKWHGTPYQIGYWAPIHDVTICTRREYLGTEPQHPRADALYAIIHVGEIQQFIPALKSHRWRRIGVHCTSWGALIRAPQLDRLHAFHRTTEQGKHVPRNQPYPQSSGPGLE